MRHKLLPVSAGHATICKRSLVGGGDLVHHCDSEAGMLVRSVELHPYIRSAFEQKTQLVSRLSKTATVEVCHPYVVATWHWCDKHSLSLQ